MRVSNIALTTSTITSLQRASKAMEEAQQRSTSGLAVQKPSDDPSAAAGIMAASSSLRSIDQYQRNIDYAGARIGVEESALDQITRTLERAKELGIQQGDAGASAQTRLGAKAEIDQLIAFITQVANTRYEGEYLFGGDQSNAPPITSSAPPFTASPITGQRTTEIARNQYVPVTHNAQQIFIDSGVLDSLNALSTALGNNDQTAIQGSLTGLDNAHDAMQSLVGDIGARSAQIDSTSTSLASLKTTVAAQKSNLQDIDIETAITQLMSRQTAYQAALLATSRITGLSLADYL